MKKTLLTLILMSPLMLFAQYEYEPNAKHPFGQANPAAPEQIKDYAPMIGECNCKSVARNPDGTWKEAIDMKWKFKYIMNGMAVQDETLKSDGQHSGSIRQFNKDSLQWNVHYYSSASAVTTLPHWEGKKEEGKIVLYRKQKAPNGADGYFRLTFYDMSDKGYSWIGEWVDLTEKIVYPTWKITCLRED